MSTVSTTTPGNRIVRVHIRGLFGIYDYSLPGDLRELRDKVILYGDNGCGKTTILKLLFHLLSPSANRGHRNALAEMNFKEISVHLADGSLISAEKTETTLYLRVKRPGMKLVNLGFSQPDQYDPPDSRTSYLSALRDLDLSIYLITDDRKILADTIELPSGSEEFEMVTSEGRIVRKRKRSDEGVMSLQHALFMVAQWINQKAASASNIGDSNVHSIYTEIIQRLAEESDNHSDIVVTKERLISKLNGMSRKAELYAKYRFSAHLKTATLVQMVQNAPEKSLQAISRVLDPYISSMFARFDALEDILKITNTFVSLFSDFYRRKTVEFDIVGGLQFYSTTGLRVPVDSLSSGERQLVRMFCYTLMSRDSPSIFIIDEPELSLNIKWQRKLIRALDALVAGTDNQFFFATHSFEILSSFDDYVVQLEPTQSFEVL